VLTVIYSRLLANYLSSSTLNQLCGPSPSWYVHYATLRYAAYTSAVLYIFSQRWFFLHLGKGHGPQETSSHQRSIKALTVEYYFGLSIYIRIYCILILVVCNLITKVHLAGKWAECNFLHVASDNNLLLQLECTYCIVYTHYIHLNAQRLYKFRIRGGGTPFRPPYPFVWSLIKWKNHRKMPPKGQKSLKTRKVTKKCLK
jgi:hypothetical protein